MNVLVVIWSIQIGGAETFSVELCKDLNGRGYKAYLCPVLGGWDRKFYESIASQGIETLSPFKSRIVDWMLWKINRIASLMGWKDARHWVNRKYVSRAIRKCRINLVVSNSTLADKFVFETVDKTIPRVVIEHGEYSYSIFDRYDVDVRPLKEATAVVSVSEWCKTNLQNSFSVQSICIPNGRSIPAVFTPQENTEEIHPTFRFALLGRGIEYKGWEDAISNFLAFKTSGYVAELWLIGGSEYLTRLQQRYADVEDIKFLGKVSEPQQVLKKIDVGLVLSRKYEAFGIVLLEFFALGKPVIATKVGAIPEIVSLAGDPAGILVETTEEGKANAEQVTKAMQLLYESPEKREKFSIRAKQIASHFSFAKTGAAYEALFKKIIGRDA